MNDVDDSQGLIVELFCFVIVITSISIFVLALVHYLSLCSFSLPRSLQRFMCKVGEKHTRIYIHNHTS